MTQQEELDFIMRKVIGWIMDCIADFDLKEMTSIVEVGDKLYSIEVKEIGIDNLKNISNN